MKKMTIGDRLVLDAKLVRRALRRWRQQVKYRRWSLQGVPILFANSFPKSGTHLLTQVLEGFAQIGPAVISGLPAIVTYQGNTGQQRAEKDILADIDRLMPGDIAYGHLHAIPAMTKRLCQTGMAGFFILRDPRDVVVSHVHYVTDMAPNHIHHRYYAMELKTFDERLRASILGIPDADIPFPDIAERFNPYLGWLEHEEILTLHYEDFMGGGGSAFGRMIDHALVRGFPLMVSRDAALRALAESVDPQRSPTFRSGKIGGWKNQFNDENKQLFKEVAGELLIRLGYEEDIRW
jgi:sulfotransferase 6B1